LFLDHGRVYVEVSPRLMIDEELADVFEMFVAEVKFTQDLPDSPSRTSEITGCRET
jgi:hypothetical protein